MLLKAAVFIAVEVLLFAALLFGAAGTLAWPAAWAYLAIFFVGGIWLTALIARRDPALLAERLRSPVQKQQPLWDKIFLVATLVYWVVWHVFMGLDAVRYHWSDMPAWLSYAGGAIMIVTFWMICRVFLENPFLAPVVKLQTERGHRVISTGPYAVVRHPMYAAALLFVPSIPLILGSSYGLAGALVIDAGIFYRTAMEERELRRGLAGYTDYAARVRYRLIPGIW